MPPSKKTQNLLKRFARRNSFHISVQLDPPSPGTMHSFRNSLNILREAGVKLFDVNSSRRLCHDSIQLASELVGKSSEVIAHVTTRDSSINGLLNQILAAYELNRLRHFLIITGDPYEAGQAIFPSRGVFQTDSIGALKTIDWQFRKNLAHPLDIVLAAAVNQNAGNRALEGERIGEKISAGADFFMSQPVFDAEQASNLFDFYGAYSSKPILVGVWPLMHLKTIENIKAGAIDGVSLSDEACHGLLDNFTNEHELREQSIAKTIELLRYVKSSGKAAGVYIVAPSRNPLLLLPCLKKFL